MTKRILTATVGGGGGTFYIRCISHDRPFRQNSDGLKDQTKIGGKQQLVVSHMHNGPMISLFIRGSTFDVYSLDE